jgi:hypothetical protein
LVVVDAVAPIVAGGAVFHYAVFIEKHGFVYEIENQCRRLTLKCQTH